MLVLALTGTVALAVLGPTACTNEPFDPDALENAPPVARFYVESVDSVGLQPTSYYERTFHWSGTDPDGEVTEFHVSIRTREDEPAPWDTTTVTDTTMTFTTEEDGTAVAVFYLACRDDRGAMSDTLVRRIPLRNFPPQINLQSDFEPLANLQREIVQDEGVPVDTTYWNWGPMNFRLSAFDLDGNATMDSTFRFTLAPGEPDCTRPLGHPEADPQRCWIEAPFDSYGDFWRCEVRLDRLNPGVLTLRVVVRDEADAEGVYRFTWEVRPPAGAVLTMPDNSGSGARGVVAEVLDAYAGEGNWDRYDFWFGPPDDPSLLLATMRLFHTVIWYNDGTASQYLQEAALSDGVLPAYLDGDAEHEPGHLLLCTPTLTGSRSDLPLSFRSGVLRVAREAEPNQAIEFSHAVGAQALGQAEGLPPMTVAEDNSANTLEGVGLDLLSGAEALYAMEECEACYCAEPDNPRRCRPPWDPVVIHRVPDGDGPASVVGFALRLGALETADVVAGLGAVLEQELEVPR